MCGRSMRISHKQAGRFITTFNALFDEALPSAEAKLAERYWTASQRNDIAGRCIRLGSDQSEPPQPLPLGDHSLGHRRGLLGH